ncbi:MAG TPA: SpvB/TcaC N-terminal domain-containing protein [Nonomuraea sp.]|nr:SpvB/TcaC N-terminal domain-containing protein [Nonomuraea sp.]
MTANIPGAATGAQNKPLTPALSLPKGGGAIRGLGEKFGANAMLGSAGLTIPLPLSPSRSGFRPNLVLSYDSTASGGVFGLGWRLSTTQISRRTDQGVPKYDDSDIFRLDGDDLVPALDENGDPIADSSSVPGYRITRYLRRVESAFTRIERWTRLDDGDVHWRTLSPDNVLTVYGLSPEERITDPEHEDRVYAWLLSESRDPYGNAVVCAHLREDGAGVDVDAPHERNRTPRSRSAARHLKRVRYGNRLPLLDEHGRRPITLTAEQYAAADWMFELVLDYGDHSGPAPTPAPDRPWPARADAFSTYRPGFELRTYRLCRRALMFHHFPDEAGVGAGCLVAALELDHTSDPIARLTTITHRGYQRTGTGGYDSATLPPIKLDYSRAAIGTEVTETALENVPALVPPRQWVDLYGDGMPGILTEHRDAWYYKRNLGGGRFAPHHQVAARPSTANLNAGRQALTDVSGDGLVDLVDLDGLVPGFAGGDGAGFGPPVPFESLPLPDLDAGNVQLVDLSGDGLADLLIAEDDALVWYPSLGARGFAPGLRVALPADEERGPRLLRADPEQAVFLADMSGDGLADLVRVRASEICYWPSLGHGRFGARVVTSRSPVLDRPGQFDARDVRLADVDGSGCADLIYLGGGARLWFNESGNSWSATPVELQQFPRLDDTSTVSVTDLLGNGTACLVWSPATTPDPAATLRYIELMSEGPPRLLTRVDNSMGGETRVRYAPSTRFAVADRQAGRPWLTRLPFPVHVVERVESIDHVNGSRLVSRYAYHHGYFDGVEREFRGFAAVERFDAESFEDHVAGTDGGPDLAPEFHQPPVTVRSWFHTGAYLDGDDFAERLRAEYEGGGDLPPTRFPAGLTTADHRACVRALSGFLLRQEISTPDGLVSVSEQRHAVRRVQRGVALPFVLESIGKHVENDPADFRAEHALVLETGRFGQPLASAAVTYGRRRRDPALPPEVSDDQARTYVTCQRVEQAPEIDVLLPVPAYRLPATSQTWSHQLTGVVPAGQVYTVEELRAGMAAATEVDFSEHPAENMRRLRLLGRTRTLYRGDDLAVLPLSQQSSLGLLFESYRLAFTKPVIDAHYAGTIGEADWIAAGYRDLDGDGHRWIPSGTSRYPVNAAARFYLPSGTRDPFGIETEVTYDRYHLLVQRVSVTQAAWNTSSAVNDYRLLCPRELTDVNRNRTAVAFDPLGLPVRTAVMGKEGAGEGDTLDDPTQILEYDLFRWAQSGRPNLTRVRAREEHGTPGSAWRESFVYATGSGQVALVKTQAPGGWRATGRTILDNKGNIVKQYEPYFSPTSEYDDLEALATVGVTPIFRYDPLGRLIRTDLPDGTFTTADFDPWRTTLSDANDTVLASRWYADRGSPDPAGPEPADPGRRAAWLAARHAGTPATTHLDSLGRPIYTVTRYEDGRTAAVRSRLDLTGRDSAVFDQLGRETARGFTSMTGIPVFGVTAERGARWTFADIGGGLMRGWDEHGRVFQTRHDALRRPLGLSVREAENPPVVLGHVVYGDRHPDALARNLNGTVHQTYDSAGVVTVDAADFKGVPKAISRRFAADDTSVPDWKAVAAAADYADVLAAAAPLLDGTEKFTASATYDALNRPLRVTLPDGTVLLPAYDRGGRLASLSALIGGHGPARVFLSGQTYDAKGRRSSATHGNGVRLRYTYDPASFRLTDLLTVASGADGDTAALQRLHYTYDPVGNITAVADGAQQTHFFANAVVTPETRFAYDALYQLVSATGRELAAGNDTVRGPEDLAAVTTIPHPNDTAAVRRYTERYEYDLLGNLTAMRHVAPVNGGGWTRRYRYRYQDDPADATNRLASTSRPGDPDTGPFTQTYGYDAYGNFSRLLTPNDGELLWNALDQLHRVDLGTGGVVRYAYGADGRRVRKVLRRPDGLRRERLYLGPLEIHRERRGTADFHLIRHTLHISDDSGRIAQVDTKIRDTGGVDPANPLGVPLIRFQYGNHLGSAVLETDDSGAVIGYEEYHPFGTTAYRSAKSAPGLSLKRYRFAGRERDEETGLQYGGARYYASWLGRWISPDPAGYADGFNLYRYCRNNPITFGDPTGHQTTPKYLAGTEKDRLTAESTPEQRAAFAARHGFRLIDPDPASARWTGKDWKLGPQARFEPLQAAPADEPLQLPPEVITAAPAPTAALPVPVPSPATGAVAGAGPGAPGEPRIPSAPPGTNFRSAAAAGRAAYRAANQMPPGTQAQHWTKELSAQATDMSPDVMNMNMSPLQSRKALPATTLLVDPQGRGTTYAVSGGSTYGTEHKFADRFLIPQIEDQIRQANPNADPREVAVQAGRQARWIMTGEPGPDVPGPAPQRGPFGPGFAQNVGGGFARTFVVGFAEAEVVGLFAHPTLGALGVTNVAALDAAAAVSAAPTAFAASVTLAGYGGAAAGNFAEALARQHGASAEVSIGAAVLAAASVGALIGTFVPIPGVGTAAGAAIGAAIGVIGYGLSKLF